MGVAKNGELEDAGVLCDSSNRYAQHTTFEAGQTQ